MKKLLPSIVLFLFFSCTLAGWADVGNFNDYGNSSVTTSSDYSYDQDASSDNSYWYDDHRQQDDFLVYMTLVLLGIGMAVFFVGKGLTYFFSSSKQAESEQWPNIIDYTPEISLTMRSIYPTFREEDFLRATKGVFLQLQTAWTERNWESVRSLETNDLYQHHAQQIEAYKVKHEINKLEDIKIKNAYLFSLAGTTQNLSISVVFQVRMLDYVISERNYTVIKGSATQPVYKSYFYVFTQDGPTFNWLLSKIIPITSEDIALRGGVLIEQDHSI